MTGDVGTDYTGGRDRRRYEGARRIQEGVGIVALLVLTFLCLGAGWVIGDERECRAMEAERINAQPAAQSLGVER